MPFIPDQSPQGFQPDTAQDWQYYGGQFLKNLNPAEYVNKALLPAADVLTQSTVKPLIKGAATASVGPIIAAGQQALTGQGVDQPINIPWIGNINPQANTPLQNVGLAGDFGVAASYALAPYTSALQGAGRFGAQSAAQELEYNKEATPESVGTAGIVGGAIGALTSPQALSAIGKGFKKAGERVYSSIIKTPAKAKTGVAEVVIGLTPKGEPVKGTIGKGLMERGIHGSTERIQDTVLKKNALVIAQRKAVYDASKIKIKAKDIIDKFDEAVAKIKPAPGKRQAFDNAVIAIKSDLQAGPKAYSLTEASNLKTSIQHELQSVYGYQSNAIKEADKALGRVIKESIETIAPGVKSQNVDLGFYKSALKEIGKAVASGKNKPTTGLGYVDLFLASVGAGAGSVFGPVGSGVGAVGFPLAGGVIKGMRTPLAKTGRAVLYNKAGNLLQNQVTQELAGRGVLSQLLKGRRNQQ